ncbi:MAG: fucose isomerase [Clostridia bacterium]|nr:fucose isomerase [Clostridia bacterium]MBR5768090.1 fucose isomerase [Clostridia bacterium]
MLKNIPPVISPELLKILDEMGHGDEIVIGDGNFPSESVNSRTVRADGHGGAEILDAVLSLLPLDTHVSENLILMEVTPGENVETPIWDEYKRIAEEREPGRARFGKTERFAFYDRAAKAYAVVATGERALYANVIVKKGVLI